jgi:hypothetical protein
MLQTGKMMELAAEVLKLGIDLVTLQEIRRIQDTAIPKMMYGRCMQQDAEEDQKRDGWMTCLRT